MDYHIKTEKLKLLRSQKAWSQQQLAEVAGLSLRTIQRIEKSGIASSESIKAIASAFDLKPEEFMQDKKRIWLYGGVAIAICIVSLIGVAMIAGQKAQLTEHQFLVEYSFSDGQSVSDSQWEIVIAPRKTLSLPLDHLFTLELESKMIATRPSLDLLLFSRETGGVRRPLMLTPASMVDFSQPFVYQQSVGDKGSFKILISRQD